MSEEQFLELKKMIYMSTLAIVNAVSGTSAHISNRERRTHNEYCEDAIEKMIELIAEK